MSLTFTLIDVMDRASLGNPWDAALSVTVPSGLSQLLVISCANITGTPPKINGVTLGAASLSMQFDSSTFRANYRQEWWTLDNPTAGVATVTVDYPATTRTFIYIIGVTGGKLSGLFGTFAETTASPITVTSAVGEIPLFVVQGGTGSPNTITDASSPALTTIDEREPTVSANQIIGLYSGTGASSVTGTFTISNAGNSKLLVAASVKPAATTTADTMAKQAGDNQAAQVGTAVAVPLQVLVTDSVLGVPVAGRSMTFVIASGGGSFGGSATVVTDASGIATAPAWTLGASPGINTVTVTDGALSGSPITFTALATSGPVATGGRRLIGGSLIQPATRS